MYNLESKKIRLWTTGSQGRTNLFDIDSIDIKQRRINELEEYKDTINLNEHLLMKLTPLNI